MYFSKDACDERNADDVSALNVDNKVWQMKADEIVRQKALEENSGRTLPNAKMLARQSQVYVVQCIKYCFCPGSYSQRQLYQSFQG